MYPRLISLALSLLTVPLLAQAQLPEDEIRRSSSPRGVQIRGDTAVSASARHLSATAVGSDNTAANTAGAIKNNTQIQGTTRINATVQGMQAVSVGKGNQADNAVGAIGGHQ